MCKAPKLASDSLLCRTDAVDAGTLARLGVTADTATLAEIKPSSELYGLVCAFLSRADSTRSYTLDVGKGGKCGHDSDNDDDDDDTAHRATSCSLGLGTFTFEHEGTRMIAVHQTLGEVVGTNCGPALMNTLVLVAPHAPTTSASTTSHRHDAKDAITAFCDTLLHDADRTAKSKFTIYRFHPQYHYWHRGEVVDARPIDSVVLPDALKSRVMSGLEDFFSPGTKRWFRAHGIPHKHSLLLYGTPGAGKTSLIQAIAGHFKRNLCYLSSLSHPEMTDDALKTAVQKVPSRSIIVLEDVDALFQDGRTKSQENKSALTFSGLLNALDGIGGATGQLFVLTTNHREKLDPALIRAGRVDMHVEFKDACVEQMEALFRSFYAQAADELAREFASKLSALLGERTVSMAALQAYFIASRKKSAAEAVEGVAKVIEEAEANGGMNAVEKEEAVADADANEDDKNSSDNNEEKEEDKVNGEVEATAAAGRKASILKDKEMHVHVHVH